MLKRKMEESEKTTQEYAATFENRSIFLFGEIDRPMCQHVVDYMKWYESENPSLPIFLFVNSDGGDELDTFAIVDTMRSLQCSIHTYALGLVASAAPLIVAAGDPGCRFSTSHTTFMLHESHSLTTEFNYAGEKTTKRFMRYFEQNIKKKVSELYEEFTGTPKKIWDEYLSDTDVYFNASRAKSLGIVDEIRTDPFVLKKTG